MTGRRVIYLGCLAGSLVFYFCYQGWIAWIILVTVLALPWVSLLLSLPDILRSRAELDCPAFVTMGEAAHAGLRTRSALPQRLLRGRITRQNLITGEQVKHRPKDPLPTAHCGGIRLSARRVRVCDHLGLLAVPVKKLPARTVIVRPHPLPMSNLPDLSRYIARSWRPKHGGGYAENHELRPYRPGDSLNQLHWKLSAKTGTLVIREPMEPGRELVLLTMDLSGSPHEIDRKFGRLLTASRMLLDHDLPHEIRALTANGPVCCPVADEGALTAAVDRLLCCPAAGEGSLLGLETGASWQLHIGGDPDEA